MANTTTTTSPTNSARTVVGLMGFAVLFSLIGNEIQIANGTKQAKLSSGLDKGATIIIGGLIASALLTALTGAGEAGRRFAVGLSVVTATTATLVFGGPVWSALNAVVNGGNTGTTKPTGNTAATTPTQGTATAAALAQAA